MTEEWLCLCVCAGGVMLGQVASGCTTASLLGACSMKRSSLESKASYRSSMLPPIKLGH